MHSDSSVEDFSTYRRVRQLLLGQQTAAKVDKLSHDDIDYIASLISEAVIVRNGKDTSLGEALEPIMDKAFDQAINKNPDRIAETFYPIMGPAIRRSVAAALYDMVQSLNQMLEQSLSLRSLKWRYQAWRLNKSYAELVLLKTLKYRVEQVFLIDRCSGNLIQSVVAPQVSFQDPDLVSSMLTAINDFVSDSFENRQQGLDWLKVGDLHLNITLGPKAFIAVAVRGTSSEDVVKVVAETLESIHRQYSVKLDSFDGDKDKWRFVAPMLNACLLTKKHDEEKPVRPWMALLSIALVILLVSHYGYNKRQMLLQQSELLRQIDSNDRYHIIDREQLDGHLNLTVMRDEQTNALTSVFDQELLEKNKLAVKELVLPFKAKTDLDVLMQSLIWSHPQLTFSVDNDGLKITGVAPQKQVDQLRNNPLLTDVFRQVDTSELSGDKASLSDDFNRLYFSLNNRSYFYAPSAVELVSDQLGRFNRDLIELKRLVVLAEQINRPLRQILLQGFADGKGNLVNNRKLSLQRAEMVKQLLVANGFPGEKIIAAGASHIVGSLLEPARQRRVTITIYVDDKSYSGAEDQ